MKLSGFKHKYKIIPRFSDFDMLGHVNNVRFLTFYEEARVNYLEKILQKPVQQNQVKAIVAKIECNYIKPSFPGDELCIYTRCLKTGTKSFTLESVLCRQNGEECEIINNCRTVLVSYDYEKAQSMENPASLINAIKNYEKKTS